MRIATTLALLTAGVSQPVVCQHFRQLTIPTGPEPRWIAVTDVNHDHNPDILVANAGSESNDSGSLTVLLGDGRGGFHPAVNSPFAAGHPTRLRLQSNSLLQTEPRSSLVIQCLSMAVSMQAGRGKGNTKGNLLVTGGRAQRMMRCA